MYDETGKEKAYFLKDVPEVLQRDCMVANATVWAVGTNFAATTARLKAGADQMATGEDVRKT